MNVPIWAGARAQVPAGGLLLVLGGQEELDLASIAAFPLAPTTRAVIETAPLLAQPGAVPPNHLVQPDPLRQAP